MFKATHIIKENNGDHCLDIGTKVFFATEQKTRQVFADETIADGKWSYIGCAGDEYVVLEDEDGIQQSVSVTEFEEIK